MEWRRHLGSAALMAVFLVFNTATSKDPASSAPSAPSSGAAASGVVGAPAEVDAARVATALGCPGAGGDACRVLEDFKSAGSIAEPSEDQEVYVGYSHGKGGLREYFFLQLKRGAVQAAPGVPAAAVLPYGGAARSLIPDNPGEDKDAAALVAAVKAGGKAPAGSKAADFVRTAKPPEGFRSVARTAGASQMITASGLPFVFIRRSGDRVLVVEYEGGNLLRHARSSGSSPAWVAELWRLR